MIFLAALLLCTGAFGVDFSQNSDNISDDVQCVAAGLLSHGVTSFVPTIVSSTRDTYHKVKSYCRKMF
jgi:N-acetylglucosamine-6-phosphate deacetylase